MASAEQTLSALNMLNEEYEASRKHQHRRDRQRKARVEETRQTLNLFNEEFDTSKRELIQRFLQDQQKLNKKFDEYALNSNDDSDDSSPTARNLQKKYSSAINADELNANLNVKNKREDDRDSLDSVQTECANSDTDEDDGKANVNSNRTNMERNSTARFVAKQGKPRLGRSQSLRVANKVDLSTLRHAPQPPNSPELICDGEEKPSLEALQVGRRASLRESREAKRKQPKKLLIKRTERPKSALGYRTSLSLVNEDAYEEENGFLPPDRPQWDASKHRAAAIANENSRSAPVYKNRVLNWDTDCPKSNDAPTLQDQIPDLSTPLDSSRSRGPSYAPAPIPSHTRPHPPPPENRTSNFSRNNAIRHSMPIKKRHSESNMPVSIPIVKDNPLKPINRLGTLNIALHDEEEAQLNNDASQTGRMRRFKGHGNLTGPELTPRGTHLAVLKLPPVSHKNNKKTYNSRDLPARPGTSFSFFGTSEALV